MSKHTEGPWRQHKGEDGKLYASVRNASGRCVADCGSRSDKNAQANARLIAAAPDLLDACKEALNAATVKLDTYAASAALQKEVVAKLKAAIAKAEEETG